MKILLLGGTADARQIAERLVALGHDVTTSLAGRTRRPALPPGNMRVGKFGGIPGLVAYLHAAGIERIVDATHPYAELISANAVAAASATGIPLLRYVRPAWSEPQGAGWEHVASIEAAAWALSPGAIGFITTGHEGLAHYLVRDDCRLTARLIEAPTIDIGHIRWLQDSPPYRLDDERALFDRERFTHLVTKNSGGDAARAKLVAAAERGVRVIMVARPVLSPAPEAGSISEVVGRIAG